MISVKRGDTVTVNVIAEHNGVIEMKKNFTWVIGSGECDISVIEHTLSSIAEVGNKVLIEEGRYFGEIDRNKILTMSKQVVGDRYTVGDSVSIEGSDYLIESYDVKSNKFKLNGNHILAGKDVSIVLTLVAIKESTVNTDNIVEVDSIINDTKTDDILVNHRVSTVAEWVAAMQQSACA